MSESRSSHAHPQVDEADALALNQQENTNLKFLVIAINRDISEVGLASALTVKDLESLDTDTFCKILVYLLTSSGVYTHDQLNNKREVLLRLTEAGLPRLEYDATLDYIYWAVKRLLRENDDIFVYSLLLNPKANPKSVRRVLLYLLDFNLFTDSCSEAFDNINAEVAEENQLRIDLYRKIGEVNSKLASKTAELDEKKEVAPTLQEKLNEINAELAQEEDAVAELERQVQYYKSIYDAEDQERARLERQLQEVLQEKARLQSLIVPDPEVVQMIHADESEKLKKLIKEREAIGLKLQELSVKDTAMDDLIRRAEEMYTRVQECIELMIEVGGLEEEYAQCEQKLHNLKVELNSVNTNLKHLAATRDNTKAQNDATIQEFKKRNRSTRQQLKSFEEQVSKLKIYIKQQLSRKAELDATLANLESGNTVLKDKLQRNLDWLKDTSSPTEELAQLVEGILLEFEEHEQPNDERSARQIFKS